jgi:hypothetical protein
VSKLTGSTIGADGGYVWCKFVRAPAKTAVAVRVHDPGGNVSNLASQKVKIKKKRHKLLHERSSDDPGTGGRFRSP